MKAKIKIALCTALLTSGIQMFSQVGIGIANPSQYSILDLTQTGTVKGLLLPVDLITPSDAPPRPIGMIVYFNDQVYVKQTGGYNAMNPWKYKFNGNTAEDITFNPTSMIGVGIGVNTGNIFGNLHVSATGKDVNAAANSSTSAAFFIGNATSATHMIFDADEIMVKATNTTGGLLKLQEEDGSIRIGSNRLENVDSAVVHLNTRIGSTANSKTLTVHGNIDTKAKIKENGNDLLPRGSVIAFFGAAVPAGWALCDGRYYDPNNNANASATPVAGYVLTPNLNGRTIIGVGNNGETTYTYNTPGGLDNRPLVAGNIPNHQHTGSTNNDGAHSHTGLRANLVDNDDNDDTFCAIGYSCGSDPSGPQSPGSVASTGSNHTHGITLNTCTNCGTTPVNVVSKHLVLRYIMKL